MRSMSDSNKNDYQVSMILEHDASADLFGILIEWLKSQQNSNWEKSALLNNPSFRFINLERESIKIDDIRNFNQELAFSNYSNEKRYFIFFNSDLTTLQAQNAALKSIEEPPKNTQIVLLTPSLEKLLPTIISRCKVTSLRKSSPSNKDINTTNIYEKILNSKHYELTELSNDYKERGEALLLFGKLLSYLHIELNSNVSRYKKKQLTDHLKIILKTIEQLNQNTNVKLTTENCFFDLISS